MIDISGLDSAIVLMNLYNASIRRQNSTLTYSEAVHWIHGTMSFAELAGKADIRVVLLDTDTAFDETYYDLDNGRGAAQAVVDQVRRQVSTGRLNNAPWPQRLIPDPWSTAPTLPSTDEDDTPTPAFGLPAPDIFATAFQGGESGGAGGGADFSAPETAAPVEPAAPESAVVAEAPEWTGSESVQAEAPDPSSSWEDKSADVSGTDTSSSYESGSSSADSGSSYDSASSVDSSSSTDS